MPYGMNTSPNAPNWEAVEAHKNRIALVAVFAQNPAMLARVLSAALSAIAPGSATADVNGIEAVVVMLQSWMAGRDSVEPKLDFLGRSHGSTESRPAFFPSVTDALPAAGKAPF
jgi:hypothetical protein